MEAKDAATTWRSTQISSTALPFSNSVSIHPIHLPFILGILIYSFIRLGRLFHNFSFFPSLATATFHSIITFHLTIHPSPFSDLVAVIVHCTSQSPAGGCLPSRNRGSQEPALVFYAEKGNDGNRQLICQFQLFILQTILYPCLLFFIAHMMCYVALLMLDTMCE